MRGACSFIRSTDAPPEYPLSAEYGELAQECWVQCAFCINSINTRCLETVALILHGNESKETVAWLCYMYKWWWLWLAGLSHAIFTFSVLPVFPGWIHQSSCYMFLRASPDLQLLSVRSSMSTAIYREIGRRSSCRSLVWIDLSDCALRIDKLLFT